MAGLDQPSRVKALLERVTGSRIYRRLPRGVDLGADIERSGARVHTVFDVGANIGQSAAQFRRWWPACRIHSFEPASDTFATLERNTGALDVTCHRMALGREPGTATLFHRAQSGWATMVTAERSTGEETVEVSTVDAAMETLGVSFVDLLKIDTEGFDADVLAGGHVALSEHRVGFVMTEVGFETRDNVHAEFGMIRGALEASNYRVFGFYNQSGQRGGRGRLLFADAVFVSEQALERMSTG